MRYGPLLLLVVHDNSNDGPYRNYKLVAWDDIAADTAFGLAVDTTGWNVRVEGDPPLEPNRPPEVDAGIDQIVQLNIETVLDATVDDDNLSIPPAAVTTSWSVISGPGTASFADTLAVDTTVSFTTAGQYILRLTANDGRWTAWDEVTIDVLEPPNTPPVSFADYYTVAESETLIADDAAGTAGGPADDGVLANDFDDETDSLSAVLVSGPANGTLVLHADGTFVYTHDGTANYSDQFTYRAYDGAASSNLALVTITVVPQPITASFQDGVDQYTGTRDTTIKAGLPQTNFGSDVELEMDGSPDKATLLQWDIASIPPGSTILSAAITVRVTNKSSDLFELYALTTDWMESEATWRTAANGRAWNAEGVTGDGDHSTTSIGALRAPSKGLVTIDLNAAGVAWVQSWVDNAATNRGLIVKDYADESDNGLDFVSRETPLVGQRPKLSITYTPTDPPVNHAPNSVDDSYTVAQGGTLTANDATGANGDVNDNGVLANDSDVDGNPLSAVLFSAPAHGSLSLRADGTFDYVHDGSENFTDSFVYRATDGSGDDGATVRIVISPVNADPVVASFRNGVDGYSGSMDTTIKSELPEVNFGSDWELEMDGSPDKATLLKWDVSSIAPTNTIVSASITVRVTNKSDDSFELYPMLRDWVEHEATWLRPSSGEAWGSAGAAGATDRGSTVVGALTAPSKGFATIELGPAGVATVQSWIDDPATNFGLIVQDYANGSSNGLDFDSHDVAIVEHRPELSVRYTVGTVPAIPGTASAQSSSASLPTNPTTLLAAEVIVDSLRAAAGPHGELLRKPWLDAPTDGGRSESSALRSDERAPSDRPRQTDAVWDEIGLDDERLLSESLPLSTTVPEELAATLAIRALYTIEMDQVLDGRPEPR